VKAGRVVQIFRPGTRVDPNGRNVLTRSQAFSTLSG
jgi:hypothetical protein